MAEGLSSKGMKDCGPDIAKAIGILFLSRTMSHMAHLKTTSYATHKALNEFYDSVIGLTDDLAEASQGQYGILDIPFISMSGSIKDPIGMLQGHLKQLESTMSNCDEDYILNIFQEVQKLYRCTLYKLINLS